MVSRSLTLPFSKRPWTTVEPRMAVSASTRENQAHAQQNLPRTRSKLRKVAMVNKGKARETQVAEAVGPADSTWDGDSDNADWRWTYLNDFTSSKAAPMFSKDGSYFFSFAGSSVKILSVSSGQVVSELTVSDEKCSGRQPIRFTSAVINPDNAFQLITSTLEGRIIIWDFLNAIILREIDVGKPIHCICANKNVKDSIFVAASLDKKKTQENDAIVLRISLNHGSSGKSSAEVRAVGKTRSPSGIALSPSGKWLVATGGHTVYVSRTSALEAGFIKYVAPDRLTTLAMHPSEDYFATGDEKGSIRVWYCLNDGAVKSRGVEKKAQTASLHWHAHAVASLSFTPNGAYLLSGGEEAVLVIWQLHTGKKEFVPRVGSAIVTISVFQGPLSEEYLLGLQDGTFCFISPSSLRIARSFSQLKIGLDNVHSDSRTTYAPVAFHQLSSTLILPSSHQSSLQLYSPYSSSLIGELEVSPSNRVSRRDDKPMDSAKVRLVALASSGLWMSTVDVREEEAGYQPEIFLKIWSWDLKANRWQLHSRIDQPHGSKYPVQLGFSPHNLDGTPLYLSSCGEDGTVKIWKLRVKAKEESWLPHATLNFPRTYYVKNLTWSPDGTIFAVGLVNTVVLYDTTFTDIDSLTTFEHNSTISIHFVGNRYLLVVGQKSLTSWDLISRSVAWSFIPSGPIDFVVPHPQEGSFAVFLHPKVQETSVQTKVFIFDAESPRPRAEHTLPFKLRNITSTGSLQRSKAYNLIGLTDTSSVVLIDHDSFKSPAPRAPTLSFQSGRATIFQDMFGGAEFGGAIVGPSTQLVRQPVDPRLGELFAQPTHLMAPISSLFDPLITSLIQPSAVPTNAPQSLSDDEDLEDEVMEDVVMTSSTAESTLVPSIDPAALQSLVNFFRKSCQMAHGSPSKILENGKSKKGRPNGMPITPTPTKPPFSPESHRQSIA